MISLEQQAAVHFCEQWLGITFMLNTKDSTQVESFLDEYLKQAIKIAEEITCESELNYINSLS